MENLQILRYVMWIYFAIFLGLNFAWLILLALRHPQKFFNEWLDEHHPEKGYHLKDSFSYTARSKKVNLIIYLFFVVVLTMLCFPISWVYIFLLIFAFCYIVIFTAMVIFAYLIHVFWYEFKEWLRTTPIKTLLKK